MDRCEQRGYFQVEIEKITKMKRKNNHGKKKEKNP